MCGSKVSGPEVSIALLSIFLSEVSSGGVRDVEGALYDAAPAGEQAVGEGALSMFFLQFYVYTPIFVTHNTTQEHVYIMKILMFVELFARTSIMPGFCAPSL